MDISLRIFLDADEFLVLLRRALALGASIHYEPGRGAARARVDADQTLPAELENLLRAPLEVESPHVLFIRLESQAVESQRTIAAYFGGVDAQALYITSVSTRSIDEATLATARELKRALVKVSRTGLAVVGGRPVHTVRFTRGAELAARNRLELSGGGNVRYEITNSDPGFD